MIRHVSLSVRGALDQNNARLRQLAPCITVDGKKLKTAEEVREFLKEQLTQGHEMLPMTDCDNHDWKKGCLGHASVPGRPEPGEEG